MARAAESSADPAGGLCRTRGVASTWRFVPIAAGRARPWRADALQLDAFVALPDGTRNVRAHATVPVASLAAAEQLGAAVAGDLLAQGADAVLAQLSTAGPA